MSTTSFLNTEFSSGILQTVYGVVMIGLVLALNSYVIVRTVLFFRASLRGHTNFSRFRAILFFIISTQFLALAQLAFIAIWAASIFLIGLFPDWESALRLSASSYTTMGIFAENLPNGWHLIPTFIAFSGLFSFAWAASSTISMLSALIAYLDAESKIDPQLNLPTT